MGLLFCFDLPALNSVTLPVCTGEANVCAQQLVSCAIYRTNHYPAGIILS
ncbi:hypothetical protein yberc0001_17630 [Yersinia bercovieri ATCC 43970]|uniref:Uncharacterized protein n=1 Tax=Yersinia bercovieri ATCC 43970 TaxID=349968 RepID=A0ABM9XZF0_YERBE|nr:hypothetical protein yberc0001_17630 [Yersinia bercovieri ATCC 43970]